MNGTHRWVWKNDKDEIFGSQNEILEKKHRKRSGKKNVETFFFMENWNETHFQKLNKFSASQWIELLPKAPTIYAEKFLLCCIAITSTHFMTKTMKWHFSFQHISSNFFLYFVNFIVFLSTKMQTKSQLNEFCWKKRNQFI